MRRNFRLVESGTVMSSLARIFMPRSAFFQSLPWLIEYMI